MISTPVLIFVSTVAILLTTVAIVFIFYSRARIFRKHKQRYDLFINRVGVLEKWNLSEEETILYDRFIKLINTAFSLDNEERFIEPDDDILDTYKLLTNNPELFDTFELEDLDELLKKEFGVSIEGKERLSFRQIFEKIRIASSK